MGTFTNQITWEALRSINSASLTGTYLAMGGPLLFPSYILKIVNNSNVLVTVSINGTSDIDVVPAGGFFLYDEGKVGANSSLPAIPAGTQIFVKGAAGVGLIYMVSQYIVTT